MFGIFRIFIGVVVGMLLFFLLCKYTTKGKVALKYIVTVSIVIVIITITGFIPFENLIYEFNSAEEVYKYYYFGEDQVDVVVEGNESDFVIGTKNNTLTHLIVPKTATGWKLGSGLNTKMVFQKRTKDFSLFVYQYRNTNDYFVIAYSPDGEELTLLDEYDIHFHSFEKNVDSLEKGFIIYYAHCDNNQGTVL